MSMKGRARWIDTYRFKPIFRRGFLKLEAAPYVLLQLTDIDLLSHTGILHIFRSDAAILSEQICAKVDSLGLRELRRQRHRSTRNGGILGALDARREGLPGIREIIIIVVITQAGRKVEVIVIEEIGIVVTLWTRR
jgi:hypothetical protein